MTAAEQVTGVRDELNRAHDGIVALAARATDAQWSGRPKSGGWSAAECVAHLTVTTEVYLPLLRAAQATVAPNAPLPQRYGMGFGGRLLAWILEPPARIRSRTIAAFLPEAIAPRVQVMAAFSSSQGELIEWTDSVKSVALDHAMVTSPFNARLKYNAYGALRVLAAHQRRHLWQAERAVRGLP